MSRKVLIASVVLSLALASTTAAIAADDAAAPAAGPNLTRGKAVFQKYCTMCHEVEVVTVQRHSRAAWVEVLVKMRELGLDATQREINDVLDYLTATFPEE